MDEVPEEERSNVQNRSGIDLEQLRQIAKGWQASIVDYTRRNNLLFFKPRSNTLRLDISRQSAFETLISGGKVSLSDLCHEEDKEKLDKAATSISKKQQVSVEEIGVSPVYVAFGFLSWVDPDTPASREEVDRATNAPILLLQVELVRARGQQNQWSVVASGDLQVNGVIKHALEKNEVNSASLNEDSLSDISTIEMIWSWINNTMSAFGKLPEAETTKDAHFAGFSYQDEAIWRDLGDIDLLLESLVVRGLAGEGTAISTLQKDSFINPETFDTQNPTSERLVLDADSSQMEAIQAAISGVNLVIEGPPGSGKSQTITNLLAEIIASGKTALFVAQKRAAITAVMDRLEQTGLRDLILDVHEAHRGVKVAEQIQSSYENMKSALSYDGSRIHKELTESRTTLTRYKDACFDNNRPLGLSLIDLRKFSFSSDTPKPVLSALPVEAIAGLERIEDLEDLIEELVITGGLRKDFATSAQTFSIEAIKTDQDLESAIELIDQFTPADEERISWFVTKLPDGIDLEASKSIEGLQKGLTFLAALLRLAQRHPKSLRNLPDNEMLGSMAAASNQQTAKTLTVSERIRAFLTALKLFGPDRDRRIQGIADLQVVQSVPAWTNELPENYNELSVDELTVLAAKVSGAVKLLQGFKLNSVDLASAITHLRELARDASMYRVPRYFTAERGCSELGFPSLAEALREMDLDQASSTRAREVVRSALGQKLYDDALRKDSRLRGLTGDQLGRFVEKFRSADVSHLKQNAALVRRMAAESFKNLRDTNPAEDRFLVSEYQRKRAHKPLRVLAEKAPNLMLAANPIWAMSPIQVSNYLPRGVKFDYVIFDEASQIKPEVAIPALVRGTTAVVAGDSNQLPPTNFFSSSVSDSEAFGGLDDESELLESTVNDSESILEAMERIVGQQKRRLSWHYRSRDERLIAVSNMEIYGSSLTTFPASDTPDALQHVIVTSGQHAKTASRSQNNEIERVLAIARDHVRNHPEQSLGIITFGMKHLKPLEFAFADLEARDKDFRRWVEDFAGKEPFFVKNLERVQGDERDHIVISTGYGKNSAGQLQLNWGPLSGVPGRRRLNVAISRAKRKMTLVTSFTVSELEAKNIKPGTGAELFRKFMEFLDNDGAHYRGASEPEPLNSFELDIKTKLERAGVVTETQHGVGSYRIDFVVPDDEAPGKYLLAIEADGAQYHSSAVARERDRLRQELLEARGWIFHRIWSTDWFSNPQNEVEKVIKALRRVRSGETAQIATPAAVEIQKGEDIRPERRPRPIVPRQDKIDDYSDKQILDLIKWVKSDGVLRTNEEVLAEVRSELGFKRDGSRIRNRIVELL